MSDDKKRDRALQHRVRERQAKTGESYQAAWRQITGPETPPQPQAQPPRPTQRLPLPMSSSVPILPGQSAQITARPQAQTFCPDRLLIKNADHWIVDLFFVGQWLEDAGAALFYKLPLIENKNVPASAFSVDSWHDLIERSAAAGEEVVLTVTYTGPNKQGEPFEAALFGWVDGPPMKDASPEVPSTDERISERGTSPVVQAGEHAQAELIVGAEALFVDRLTITDAEDWVVHDVRTKGGSIFVQMGTVPGELFSGASRVVLVPLASGDRVEIEATYVGKKTSSQLVFEIAGTTKVAQKPRELSYFLPMSTSVPILPTQSAQITGRPQKSFVADRVVIAAPDGWIVNDIRVGNRSQFVQSGDIPALSFSSCVVGGRLVMDGVPTQLEFAIVTTYVGVRDDGEPFYCGVQGRLA